MPMPARSRASACSPACGSESTLVELDLASDVDAVRCGRGLFSKFGPVGEVGVWPVLSH